jgi:hypothetical protein
MSGEELEALAADVDQAEQVEAEQAAVADAAPVVSVPVESDPGLVPVIALAVKTVGNAICVRASVETLNDVEVSSLAEAFANVAAQYDLSRLDPKAAAWIGAGIAVVGVAAPRVAAYQAARAPMALHVDSDARRGSLGGEGEGDGQAR